MSKEERMRAPLHDANFRSRLPGPPKVSKLPGPSKLPLTAPVKRTQEDSDSSLSKRRKLSNDRTPPAVKRVPQRATARPAVLPNKASKAAPRVSKTTAKPVASKAATQPKKPAPKLSGKSGSTGSLQNAAAAQGTAPGKKSRPAWDLKGRLADMEEQMKLLTSRYKTENDLNQQKAVEIETLTTTNETLLTEYKDYKVQLSNLKNSVAQKETELSHLNAENAQLTRSLDVLRGDYSAAQSQVTAFKCTVGEMSAAKELLQATLHATKESLEASQLYGRQRDRENASLKEQLSETEELVRQMKAEIRAFESERRVLHNTIQELKGNIRVFCRVRPLLHSELDHNDTMDHISFQADNKTLEIARLSDISPNETLAGARKGAKYEFKYDRVFTPENSQADVFDEISQLVQSALDGYNVCIFAYGQTGSGKTYTMEGAGDAEPELQGMIPRSVSLVFDFVSGLVDKGWKYEFEASFLEIYNETIRDLLGDSKDNTRHEIKMVTAKSNEVYVTNLTQVKVTEREQVHKLLKRAAESRAVAETKCNARSSRSHSVFRMRMEGHNSHTDEKCYGVLNLIDLAGSERIKDSGSEGQRLKEATAINGSLSHLGNVIMALANKDGHVPYRNSKLTHLLQNSLGGNSKVLMFVNVSPREECLPETLNSLRFATKVNNCHIGTAQKQGAVRNKAVV